MAAPAFDTVVRNGTVVVLEMGAHGLGQGIAA